MDKADVALIVSAASALFTGVGLVYARRLAKNDSERMKRKKLVIEVSIEDIPEREGWKSILLGIRNHERVAATVFEVASKRPDTTLVGHLDFYTRDSLGGYTVLPSEFPESNAKATIPVRWRVEADGTSPSAGSGSVIFQRFYTTGPVTPEDINVQWRWNDNTPT